MKGSSGPRPGGWLHSGEGRWVAVGIRAAGSLILWYGESATWPSPHRCPLKTLQKCEIALEKLKNDMAVVSRAPRPGGVGRAVGITGKVRAHLTVNHTHGLGGAFTVQNGQRGLTVQPGDPAQSLLPGQTAVGTGDVEEIIL